MKKQSKRIWITAGFGIAGALLTALDQADMLPASMNSEAVMNVLSNIANLFVTF